MAQGLRLELRQSQRLAMTPQLQQAIRLLQMSNIELAAFVAGQVENNPLLALAEPPGDAAPDAGGREATLDSPVDRWTQRAGGTTLGAEVFDTGAENIYDAAPGEGAAWAALAAGGRGFDGPDLDLDARPGRPATLREHLLAQLGQMRADAAVAALARLIVEELDEAGYLRGGLGELAERLGAGMAALEAALALVQACEPTGVGARSLAECLALQLAERGRLDPAMAALLDNLELVARGERRRLRALCGVDDEDLGGMLVELRALDPRPGTAFLHERAETRIADVLLRRAPGGGWELELNPHTLPRVLIDRRYAARLGPGGAAARGFLAECRASAHWLKRSLDQRARTILAVSAEIVRRQEAFLAHGIAGLRPLTLRMVAEATGLHESTVSRVTANKAIATPRGVLDLRFFFTNAVGEDGPAAAAVRHRIRALVQAESPGAVLSDEAIVELLQRDGVEIARRTVAKYRKALGIPSSAERRRRNAALAPG
jgi:RNA polymerase sigma-54 factor